MKKNEDRIWDILLEDAVRDIPTPAEPQEMGDHTRRLLQPVGPLGVDRGRSMRRTRGKRWTSVTVTAIAFVLVAAMFYSAVTWLPKLAEDNHPDQPQSAENNNQSPVREDGGQDAPDKSQPNNAPEDEPKDDTQPETNSEPKPKPQPEPKHEPDPKPKDLVEQPKPEPETQPEPENPENTVEQPKQPEDTTPDLTKREPRPGHEIFLLNAADGANLVVANVSSGDNDEPAYRETGNEIVFADGSFFKCLKPVELFAGGQFIRLDGEIEIHAHTDGGTNIISHKAGNLYVDTRGSGIGLSLGIAEYSTGDLYLQSGALLSEASSSRVDVSVFEGKLVVSETESIPAGKRARFRDQKMGNLKDLRDAWAEVPFLKGLANRVVYREDFNFGDVVGPNPNLPQGRLREGDIKNGALTGKTVFWGYPENIAYQPGQVIRIRVKFSAECKVTLNQFCKERNDNYSYEFDVEEDSIDKWRVLEVPVDVLLERTNHEGHPQEGESFMSISIACKGNNAQVELDWVELIRAVK